jgi:hypothetical protein
VLVLEPEVIAVDADDDRAERDAQASDTDAYETLK